jgi:hypothetical protein
MHRFRYPTATPVENGGEKAKARRAAILRELSSVVSCF